MKYSFSESGCSSCPFYSTAGSVLNETRYCGGFSKKRKPKRFNHRDPRYKAPKWCPKRLSVPICRVYCFASEEARASMFLELYTFGGIARSYIYPSSDRYRYRTEFPLKMTAKQFFDAANRHPIEELISETAIERGEIIELDDGLQPYPFYYEGSGKLIPVYLLSPLKREVAP